MTHVLIYNFGLDNDRTVKLAKNPEWYRRNLI